MFSNHAIVEPSPEAKSWAAGVREDVDDNKDNKKA